MLYKRHIVCGILLVVVGIGCAIYCYIIYTSVPRGSLIMMGGEGGRVSPQDHIDILRGLEQTGYNVTEYRERAEREANKQRVARNIKLGVSAAACIACLVPGIILLVHVLSLKHQRDVECL